jgi:hypothetical protein
MNQDRYAAMGIATQRERRRAEWDHGERGKENVGDCSFGFGCGGDADGRSVKIGSVRFAERHLENADKDYYVLNT